MDKDRDGMISRQELLKYMKDHNIEFDESKLKQEKVKLVDFLREYSNWFWGDEWELRVKRFW